MRLKPAGILIILADNSRTRVFGIRPSRNREQ